MENYLRKYQADEVLDVARFIVNENFNHHGSIESKSHDTSEINDVYDEELVYHEDSRVYVERDDNGTILGSIRVLKWNFIDPLPIQKIFGINPLSHVKLEPVNDIFHFGRLAIQKHQPSLQLFKKLIAVAIAPVCEHEKNVAFAECDSKLVRVLALLGIEMRVIGDAVNYLGSETIPVMFKYDDLIDFHRNQEQISSQL